MWDGSSVKPTAPQTGNRDVGQRGREVARDEQVPWLCDSR